MRRLIIPLLAFVALWGCSSTSQTTPRQVTGPSTTTETLPPGLDTATLPGAVDPASATAQDPDHELLTKVGAIHCGYERWSVKTGTDPLASQVKLTPKPTTIHALVSEKSQLPPTKSKYPPQTKRQSAEMQAYTVTGTITAYNVEQDSDLHLVLTSGNAHMIVEIPNPQCVKGGPFLAGITNARQAFLSQTGYKPPVVPPGHYNPPFVKTSIKVTVVGVQFWDFVHGQYGVAANGVELHPVLNMSFG